MEVYEVLSDDVVGTVGILCFFKISTLTGKVPENNVKSWRISNKIELN